DGGALGPDRNGRHRAVGFGGRSPIRRSRDGVGRAHDVYLLRGHRRRRDAAHLVLARRLESLVPSNAGRRECAPGSGHGRESPGIPGRRRPDGLLDRRRRGGAGRRRFGRRLPGGSLPCYGHRLTPLAGTAARPLKKVGGSAMWTLQTERSVITVGIVCCLAGVFCMVGGVYAWRDQLRFQAVAVETVATIFSADGSWKGLRFETEQGLVEIRARMRGFHDAVGSKLRIYYLPGDP